MLDITKDTRDRAVLDLQTIADLTYFSRAEDPETITRFKRWEFQDALQDHLWLAQKLTRRGQYIATKVVSAMFVSDLLSQYRENIEVNYRR